MAALQLVLRLRAPTTSKVVCIVRVCPSLIVSDNRDEPGNPLVLDGEAINAAAQEPLAIGKLMGDQVWAEGTDPTGRGLCFERASNLHRCLGPGAGQRRARSGKNPRQPPGRAEGMPSPSAAAVAGPSDVRPISSAGGFSPLPPSGAARAAAPARSAIGTSSMVTTGGRPPLIREGSGAGHGNRCAEAQGLRR
jgi:hypothetical protein